MVKINIKNTDIINRGLAILAASIKSNMERVNKTIEIVSEDKTKKLLKSEIEGYKKLLQDVIDEHKSINEQIKK